MPHITNDAIRSVLGNIKDPKLQKSLAEILTGVIVAEVRCLGDSCNGKVIGYLYKSGKVEPVSDEGGKMWLRSIRERLDGYKGFECWCGNDSRLSLQETGHFPRNGAAPTKESLEKIIENLNHDKPEYPLLNGEQVIDGFMIKYLEI